MNYSRRERKDHFQTRSQGAARFPPSSGVFDDSYQKTMPSSTTERTTPYQPYGGRERTDARLPSKMGRIILRNLPFSTKEADLYALMGKCGKITEVRIPLKEDGKMRGFAFVQFQSINSAETAVNMFNACKVKDRIIAVDWAVAKSRYEEAKAARVEGTAKEEPLDSLTIRGKQGKRYENDEADNSTKVDNLKPATGERKRKEGLSESEEEAESDDKSSADEDDKDLSDQDGEETVKEKKPRAPKKVSDVEEGRTLFIRNIPFDTTTDQLRERFKAFGVVKYALLCLHSDSGHSKGTGFVQFREKESAYKCLSAATSGEGIKIDQRDLSVCLAETKKQRRKADRKTHEQQHTEDEGSSKVSWKEIAKDNSGRELDQKKDGKNSSMNDKKSTKFTGKKDSKRPSKSKRNIKRNVKRKKRN